MKPNITHNPDILGGKPLIAGTRMSVESLMELLASGMETDEILNEYPFLTKEKIRAAIGYSSQILKKEERYVFTKHTSVA